MTTGFVNSNSDFYILDSTGSVSTSLGTISIAGATTSSITAITGGGSGVTISDRKTSSVGPEGPREKYSASLVFSYVKSKLTKVEQGKLKARLARLQYLLETCDETEQHALRDNLITETAVAIRQQECAACGCDQYIDRKDIERFRKESKTQIDFGKLDKFPRPIPEKVRKKIQQTRDKGLFDELWVLYHNPLKEQLKSTKEKIVEKDPILFGSYAYAPDTFYFIIDWIDEVCDLTFEEFVTKIKAVDPQFSVGTVEPLTLRDINAIKDRAKLQHDRLKGTNMGNYKDLAAREEAERKPIFQRDPVVAEKAADSIIDYLDKLDEAEDVGAAAPVVVADEPLTWRQKLSKWFGAANHPGQP